MAQARTTELRRRAATLRRAGSTSGAATSFVEAVPLTIRFAGACDGRALAALAALDSAEPPTLPALVAEVHGELLAALSLADLAVVADPFHHTAELVALLQTRERQLARQSHSGLRTRLKAPLRAARALRLELRGMGSAGR